ncbi:cupin domain-containing protein [Pseudomonas entomophila]|uniref:cupin domain-containing protein n=1 Tax=Pseudomonas entomophila TaxID=312306 RepID=UPI0024049FB8|nr:cupin domain-containing protein [Pseudomonas entomophila]MDF9618379.1 cupin domain-containing protein [Pseudomonas entomophila]
MHSSTVLLAFAIFTSLTACTHSPEAGASPPTTNLNTLTASTDTCNLSALPLIRQTAGLSDIGWRPVPASNGRVTYKNLNGDLGAKITGNASTPWRPRGTGCYVALVRFKAGTDNGLHIHSDALPTFVHQGTFYTVIDGRRDEYGPGDYYLLPARRVHESGCKGPTREQPTPVDCVLFQFQSDAFDMLAPPPTSSSKP